ncbi:MAG: hypothetical protein B7X30_14260 [Thiomonas sp. 13-64-67]|nr:MAG: hypothetical protein B7X30_14260 [Thiomonas sp. 13-64-67]
MLSGALLCWLLQYGSVQHAAGQVAALFQAAIAVAWAMLLLWLLPALWGGALFTVQWACLYLAVDRSALWRVALLFGLMAVLMRAAAQGRRRSRLGFAAGVALLAVWAWATGQGGVGLLTLAAALAFVLGLHQVRCAQMQRQDLMRWRFYQLCVAALLLPLAAVAFSPSWSFLPGWSALGAMLLQAVCGGLAFPFLLAAALPEARNETAGDARITGVVGPDA